MADWIVPLSDVRLTEEDVQAIASVYRAGWLSQGPRVAEFERAFAGFVGAAEAIAVASGTGALQLSCALLDLKPSDEVVMPSLTFAATAAAVVHAGGTPVFADVRASGAPWLSYDRARAAIGPRTRAIVNVAYGGHPGEIQALRTLAAEHDLILIEDAAHAVGAWVADRHVGTFGQLGAFSFFANKNLTLGEGGMLVTDDPDLAARARRLRSHGLTTGTWRRHQGSEDGYDVLEPGFNFRLDEPRAALGTRLLGRLAADNARRQEHAAAYAQALMEIDGVRPAISAGPGMVCAWHIFPVLLAPQIDRTRFRAYMHEAGVQTSVHYPPLHHTRAFSRPIVPSLSVTEDYGRRTVTVPLFPHLTAVQRRAVVDSIKESLKRSSK